MGLNVKFDNCGLCNGVGNMCIGYIGKYKENNFGGKYYLLKIFCKWVYYYNYEYINSLWRYVKWFNNVDGILLIGYYVVFIFLVGSMGIII